MAFPQAITDHLNQLDLIKSSDDTERGKLSDLDGQLASLTAQRAQQATVVDANDTQLSAAAADTITLIQTYYRPGGTVPAVTPTPAAPPASSP